MRFLQQLTKRHSRIGLASCGNQCTKRGWRGHGTASYAVVGMSLVLLTTSTALCGDDANTGTDDPANTASQLERRITSTVNRVASTARRLNFEQLLVVVRESAANQAVPQTAGTLEAIQDALVTMLAERGFEAIVSDEANEILDDKAPRSVLSPMRVQELQEVVQFDAVVTADLRVQRQTAILRIALVDTNRPRYLHVVRLGNALEELELAQFAEALRNAEQLAFGNAANRASAMRQITQPEAAQPPADGDATTGDELPELELDPEPDAENSAGAPVDIPAINRRIVQFAVDNLGEQVGNGECWTLAAEALAFAGAQPPNMYDFGQEIDLDDIIPGDILQFTSARFDIERGYILMGTPNHTAIVYSFAGDDTIILQQNFGTRTVTVMGINFDDMTEGTVQAYRALPRR